MDRRHRTWGAWMSMLTALSGGCSSDETPAPTNAAQITQVVHFAGADPAVAHVAAGSTLIVAIESLDGRTLATNLNLNLEATASGQIATIAPVGVSQYAVTPTSIGTYNLVARNGGQTVAFTTLNVASEGGLSLAPTFEVVTTGVDSAGRACSSTETRDTLQGLVLGANQTLVFSIVPLGTDGTPMMGTLTLVATGYGVRVDSNPVSAGSLGNTLTATPLLNAKGAASVHVIDEATNATTPVNFAVTTDVAIAHCN